MIDIRFQRPVTIGWLNNIMASLFDKFRTVFAQLFKAYNYFLSILNGFYYRIKYGSLVIPGVNFYQNNQPVIRILESPEFKKITQ